jgi:DNA-binding MarR family transcriptional regulator
MELRKEAFHLLRQLFQQHTARWQQVLPELTKPQYAVMRSIAENPGIEQVALTEVAVSTKATLAEMLSRMETRGLVRREHDPDDKRRRFLFLTEEGEAVLQASIPVGNGVDAEFLGKLSEEERAIHAAYSSDDALSQKSRKQAGRFVSCKIRRISSACIPARFPHSILWIPDNRLWLSEWLHQI